MKKKIKRWSYLKRILYIFCLSLLSANLFSQITVEIKDKPIKEALKEIEKVSPYKFFYNEDLKGLGKIVTLKVSNATIDVTMKQLLNDSNISFEKQDGNIILLVPQKVKTDQQKETKQIKGIIKDNKGESIIGASVQVKGVPAIGTVTDFDGNFTLKVPDGAVLSISYIGFQSIEIKVGDKTAFDIVLHEDEKLLDEVIVVGYGVQRKRDVTTSISSLRASEIKDMPVSSIEQALVGRMAGVQITQPNGTPGAGMNIKVRGVGTVTAGSSPLYVIDGVPLSDDVGSATGISVSPLASIEMSDIESIEVLKDASAAAIYGSRGSNGVVIITTKRGSEGKPVVSYTGYLGAQMITDKIDVLDAYEYSQLVFDGHNASYYDALAKAGKATAYDPWATNQQRWDNLKTGTINLNQGWMMPTEVLPYVRGEKGLTDTDWQDEIMRTGFITKHNLSVSGGNKNIRYLVSGNYQNEEGIVVNSDFTKMGFRTKVDMKYSKWKFGGNINLTRNIYNLVNTEGRYGDDGVLSLALGAAPIYPVKNTNGEYNYEHNNTTYGNSKLNNPVAVARLIDDKMTALQMLGTAYAEYELIKDLSIKTQGSWHYNNYVRDYYRPAALPNSTDRTPPSNPIAESRTKNKYTWVWENTMNYKKTINSDHTLSGLAGWTAQKYEGNANRITATDLPQNDMLGTIPSNSTATKYDSNKEAWSLLSALARVQYNFQDKYMFSAAVRADGSSRFGENNRWGYFPSFSGAWYMTEEKFMKPVSSWLTNLKLRASWGVTGNMNIGNYASYGLVDGDNYPFGGSPNIGMKESTIPNPDIGWEKTSQVNLGAEIGLFKWLNLEIDVYQGTTTDMLLEVPVMEASGFSTMLQNIGKLENKGLEITLSTNHKVGKIIWTNNFNYAMNRNKVKSLGNANEIVTQANSVIDFVTRVGEPIGSYYTYVTDGVYLNQSEIDRDVANGIIVPNAQPGDFRFKKYGKDDIINADDKQMTGNYMPDFTYGYSTTLKFKEFDFSLSLQGVYGNEIANINRRYLANMEGNANQLAVAKDRWVSESQSGNGKVYRANRAATGMNSVISTWHIEDGSYMRIREITLGYTLPKNLLKRFGVSNLRVYGSAFNPFTFTNYSGYNPEVSTNSSPIMQGVDYGTYPLSKSFVFGLNFTL
ncbi:SusC/RagA family TonB-linked outer membrane protein [Dysgonomonas sp. Marseille-P4677]|uniref:SusC/RagA family TonB-linked outer membrane protein n=1 Tax=Dysgonomonas sp. Marseille-P4677 TaxID=2364790 RepID=UPI0019135C37|nr:SusC/RagA family TonB-linked outer membrane protein [Dysgonomonas sp. Marseille-P4677]MBK5722826.1 SusC/RagA family TonB-linked outer membrane protein [Dysgonomonas sp. Marseille-P4677]